MTLERRQFPEVPPEKRNNLSLVNLVKPKYRFNRNRMIFEGYIGLYLLVEERLKGQRLDNM